MNIFIDAFIGFCISVVINTITQDGHILSFFNRFDKYELISKPLWLCTICSSFWYTLIISNSLYSLPIAMFLAVIYNKYDNQ